MLFHLQSLRRMLTRFEFRFNKGVASEMCKHSQCEALSREFRAMQYNLVVSTNRVAIRLWKREGFEVIGTLPEAFRHSRLGFVDAFIMYKQLLP